MAKTGRQIGLDQLGLGSVLKQYRLFVPPNQREYAWTDDEVTQLFYDFGRAINEGDYFLGTIVTIPRAAGSLEVVDGQQRLATTAILLAAIRNYLAEIHEDLLVQSIDNEILSGIDRAKRERVPKIRLNTDDHDLFSRIVTGPDPVLDTGTLRPSHQRLVDAFHQAQKYVGNIVATLDPKDHGTQLNRWLTFIEHSALVVLLQVPDDADAYRMFETLNDRGLRTTQADLIKNYLFGRSNERIAETQGRWAQMRGALESLEDEDITVNFLRHALIVQHGFLRQAQVYDTVQQVVNSEKMAVSFALELENLANVYVSTFNPEHERWNVYAAEARRGIQTFNLLNIAPMRPLLLAIAARMNKKQATSSFQFLISLGVRLLVAASTRSASVEIPLADAAKDVSDRTITTVDALRAKLAVTTPTDTDFRLAFELARVSNARLARYYLRSLEIAANGEPTPWFIPIDDSSVINLQHVLPKKPEGGWSTFDDEALRSNTNRLGNLALMKASDNSKVKSAGFAEKKPIYRSSPYVLTNRLADFDDWTPDSIAERQKGLAALAVKTWPVS